MANFNLDVTHKVAVEDFAKKDPKEMAFLSGCFFREEENKIIVKYLGENYIVQHPNGVVTKEDGGEVNISLQILLFHYLTTAKGQELTKTYISFKELPDGFIYIDPFTKRVISPMLKLFSRPGAMQYGYNQRIT